jgi:hypothetical protein
MTGLALAMDTLTCSERASSPTCQADQGRIEISSTPAVNWVKGAGNDRIQQSAIDVLISSTGPLGGSAPRSTFLTSFHRISTM